ncbi:hypothetical protein ACWD26_43620 [Streptomyces sp. NPDC002787]
MRRGLRLQVAPHPVWNRYALTPGTELAGPAIFEERESSCSFGPDCRIRVTQDLALVVEVGRAWPRSPRSSRRGRMSPSPHAHTEPIQ